MAEQRGPTYEELSRHHGLDVPRAYHELVKLAHEVSSQKPRSAFEPIGLAWLDFSAESAGKPRWPGDDGRYADTPSEVVVFGSEGTDGVHFGFLLDDETREEDEYPIVEVFPNTEIKLVASTFREFLGYLIASSLEVEEELEEEASWMGEIVKLKRLLETRLGVRPPRSTEEQVEKARRERLASRPVPTADGLGVLLPPECTDREYLAGIRWPANPRRAKPDEALLDEAERRLARGEHGTALVLARNFRHLYWYSDWKEGRRYIRRTAAILEKAYSALGRKRAAMHVRVVTAWAVEHVQ